MRLLTPVVAMASLLAVAAAAKTTTAAKRASSKAFKREIARRQYDPRQHPSSGHLHARQAGPSALPCPPTTVLSSGSCTPIVNDCDALRRMSFADGSCAGCLPGFAPIEDGTTSRCYRAIAQTDFETGLVTQGGFFVLPPAAGSSVYNVLAGGSTQSPLYSLTISNPGQVSAPSGLCINVPKDTTETYYAATFRIAFSSAFLGELVYSVNNAAPIPVAIDDLRSFNFNFPGELPAFRFGRFSLVAPASLSAAGTDRICLDGYAFIRLGARVAFEDFRLDDIALLPSKEPLF